VERFGLRGSLERFGLLFDPLERFLEDRFLNLWDVLFVTVFI
jgi:hypothetical protein